MLGYKDLIEAVVKREMGILGPEKAFAVARDAGLIVGPSGVVLNVSLNKEDLGRLIQKLNEKYGVVAVMGCKVALLRLARENNLELPAILR